MTGSLHPSAASLLGVVLAGGHSTRFGRDKAEARVGGVAMLDRAIRVLAEVVDDVVVVGRAEWTANVEAIPDARPGQGPMGGLETALHEARERGHGGVLLLACDLPLVEAELLSEVVSAWSGSDGLAAPWRDGRWEPLSAAYGIDVLPEVEACLARGERALHVLLNGWEGPVIRVELARAGKALLNVNAPSDLERAERTLAGGGGPSAAPGVEVDP